MLLSLKANRAIELAYSVSRVPIILERDPGLDVWSAVRFPINGQGPCTVSYHPDKARFLDYLVTHECGHIYRFFSAPAISRLTPFSSDSMMEAAKKRLANEHWNKKVVPQRFKDQYLTRLCIGLLRQLTNAPVDSRIESWMYESFPDLRDIQADALRELHTTAAKCLSKVVKEIAPPSVYRNSNAMNYATTKVDSHILQDPRLLEPYVRHGFEDVGEKLYALLSQKDSGHAGDMQSTNAWARELEIRDWYDWGRPS